jgi:hypothetical protein
MEAISRYDLAASPAGHPFGVHSPAGEVEAIEAVPEGLFATEGSEFRAVATVYVVFGHKQGKFSIRTEELPAIVRGHFEDIAGKPRAVVDDVEVDRSSLDD